MAIYETFARMSQPWINNIPEVDWHGNNGNIVIGNEVASSRYTECRLSKATEEGLFYGIKKNNIPMIDNFSEDDKWPAVLPAIMPRLLVNGCQGIGSTIANTWLPMNLIECTKTIITYAKDQILDYSAGLIDFPTGGTIINKDDLHIIHETGKGKVIVQAKYFIKNNIISITELPYQVYVEELLDEIKKLIENNTITGINDILNKTDKNKLLIEIICDGSPDVVLHNLFANTALQKTFNANQYALLGKTPLLFTLKDYVNNYLSHNTECIRKEYEFELNKAEQRIEIVNGLLKALEDIDNIIALIKKSSDSKDAMNNLITKYDFTENQAKAIVSMKLGSLAHLESIELNKEQAELSKTIENCQDIIGNENKIIDIIIERLQAFTNKYGVQRRSQLEQINMSKKEKLEKLIEPEKVVVVMTESGLIKRIPATAFKTQHRNTKGTKTQDDITSMIIRTNTVDSLMIFSDKGKMYRLSVDDIPVGDNVSRGQAIKNLVEMAKDEKPQIIYSIYKDTDAKYVLFITKNGTVKKTELSEYIETKRKTGLDAIRLRENDSLVNVMLIKDEDIMLITKKGMSIRFSAEDIGVSSRVTIGVKGINLSEKDEVVCGVAIRDKTDKLAVFTTKGYGKKVSLDEFTKQNKNGKGLCCYKTNDENGTVSCAALVSDTDKILVVGNLSSVCINASEIADSTRIALGTIIIKNNKILSVSKV